MLLDHIFKEHFEHLFNVAVGWADHDLVAGFLYGDAELFEFCNSQGGKAFF